MMRVLCLYAPAIVLVLWALLIELGATLKVLALLVLAVSVILHVRMEAHR